MGFADAAETVAPGKTIAATVSPKIENQRAVRTAAATRCATIDVRMMV
jgi:hypothetical protein